MTLSKSSLTRVLRSKFTIPNPRPFGEAGHALTGTTRNVTSAGTTTRISTPPICTAQGKSIPLTLELSIPRLSRSSKFLRK